MKVIDNFLSKNNFNELKNTLLNDFFPWYFCDGKVFKNDGDFQFTHVFFEHNKINSVSFELLKNLMLYLNVKALVKIKANLTLKEKTFKQFKFHTDCDVNCNTAVFYLNTNNGKTIFKNKKEIESVENRILIFPSNLEHAGTSTTDTPYRMVLNLNYF